MASLEEIEDPYWYKGFILDEEPSNSEPVTSKKLATEWEYDVNPTQLSKKENETRKRLERIRLEANVLDVETTQQRPEKLRQIREELVEQKRQIGSEKLDAQDLDGKRRRAQKTVDDHKAKKKLTSSRRSDDARSNGQRKCNF